MLAGSSKPETLGKRESRKLHYGVPKALILGSEGEDGSTAVEDTSLWDS